MDLRKRKSNLNPRWKQHFNYDIGLIVVWHCKCIRMRANGIKSTVPRYLTIEKRVVFSLFNTVSDSNTKTCHTIHHSSANRLFGDLNAGSLYPIFHKRYHSAISILFKDKIIIRIIKSLNAWLIKICHRFPFVEQSATTKWILTCIKYNNCTFQLINAYLRRLDTI